MSVLIQNYRESKYLDAEGEWTNDINCAFEFCSSVAATAVLDELELRDTLIVFEQDFEKADTAEKSGGWG
ncbi:MAG: hypothetical protein ABIQ35_14240 [Verrucomicrobiota bacterium]